MTRIAPALALVAVLAACAANPPPEALPERADGDLSEQSLRPGDVIRLRIWREPDMSGRYQVDENGVVVLPRLGRMTVTRETPETLKETVLEGYEEYLRNPSIDITVLRRVNILGSVNQPGLYPVDPTVTLADALAMAGGSTPQGDPDEVRLIRNGREISANLRRDTRLADTPMRSGDQIYVPERSWIARNTGIVAAGITGTVSLIVALMLR